jgi:glycosyltransferase involved in cell wall biosynthesis
MSVPLQVVEPTLEDYSGHCHALVSSFVRAARGHPIELWKGQVHEGDLAVPMTFGPDVTIHSHFGRRERRTQMLRLLHRLLRAPGRVILTTARTLDLVLIALVAPGRLPPNRVLLYFHWLRMTPFKRMLLRVVATRQPDLAIFCTTERLVDVFRGCGFSDVAMLPYPAPESSRDATPVPFRQLLYAGAARQDKGFGLVVDVVQLLAERNADIPITVQVTPEHYGKYDDATRADIARLAKTDYAPLTLIRKTPPPSEYAANFPGSICLQPYDPAEFRDRVSGVTLDALAHGCPIVATAGTWTASLIEPHGAGVALSDPDAESVLAAASTVRADYSRYRGRALASAAARGARSWGPLLDRLSD